MNKKILSSEVLEKMNDELAHRGPDDRGIYLNTIPNYQLPITNDTFQVGLGNRRLSIIDLTEHGHQPMCNEKRDVWIVFNGEIYNFQELKKELEGKGHKFKGRSDTEVILHSYEQWGVDCLQRFNGMFAFAIWDQKKKTLFIARDRVGIKPLYYYFKDGNFAFSSELKSLLKYPLFEKELNKKSLYYYLLFQYVPTPYSIFENTWKLLPGHYLILREGRGVKIKKYWDILGKREVIRKKNVQEYMEEFESLLKSSIKYRLISDVPVGAFLSGGTDSSLVVASMAQLTDKVETFTIGFEEKKYNEAPYAKEIANYLGTKHHELYFKEKDIFSLIRDLPQYYDEPFGDSSSLPTYLVSRLAKEKGVKVVLSGDGGDELFCGYNRYIWMNRMQNILLLPAIIREKVAPLLGNIPYLKLRRISQILQYKDLLQMYLSVVDMWSEKELEKLLGENYSYEELPFSKVYKKVNASHLLEKLQLVDFHTYLPEDILTKVDRASMAVSLETRVPLLDHRIAEFAYSLPLDLRYRQGIRKYLLKKVLYKELPAKFFRRPKQGFGIPLDQWLRGGVKPYIDEYLNTGRIKKEELFNPEFVKELIKKHLSGKYNYQYPIWTLLQFQLWKEKYLT
ncbi:MAG: asparagine synthase (glutamine-hydrolyzing) [Candidatus Omnitrophica bacterium]|nr:asparagine synthase (glutamine-hydrolyzing) [Candidatus Omnitrophota bacterium]MBU1047714.1 asparagine synthase (glutamine-hydrolyzing) [Candidatus Omnitrophota bacterium]MBU1631287.1 asparagine synthase (glutamine-hydrolyzing) [Candidatus Omnitrophota bacterium]MBU1888556.1 asparagine synthase (glutamine-hydrolyzing) [Candidatus Omnitrophota bacterium]